MGKVVLYVFMLLVLLAGALEEVEGVVPGVQPTVTSPETSRIPDGSATVTGFAPLSATLENEVLEFPSGEPTTDVSATSIGSYIAGTVVVLIVISVIVCIGCCFSPLGQRLTKKRMVVDWSSTPSHDGDGDGDVSLSSDLAEAPEDALNVQGLSSENHKPLVVKFRRAKPGKPDDPPISSPPGDILEL